MGDLPQSLPLPSSSLALCVNSSHQWNVVDEVKSSIFSSSVRSCYFFHLRFKNSPACSSLQPKISCGQNSNKGTHQGWASHVADWPPGVNVLLTILCQSIAWVISLATSQENQLKTTCPILHADITHPFPWRNRAECWIHWMSAGFASLWLYHFLISELCGSLYIFLSWVWPTF